MKKINKSEKWIHSKSYLSNVIIIIHNNLLNCKSWTEIIGDIVSTPNNLQTSSLLTLDLFVVKQQKAWIFNPITFTQCDAVTIQFLSINAPPQKCELLEDVNLLPYLSCKDAWNEKH